MTIETARFGSIEIDEKKIITFRDGIPGLEEYKNFAIINIEEYFPILWLQSTEEPSICLPVIDFMIDVSEYVFTISEEDKAELELTEGAPLYYVNVLVIPDEVKLMTVNLAAPIVVNPRAGKAKQIILSDGEYNVRHPIFQEIFQLSKEDDADAGSV